jgi:AhpC/TSA family
MAHERLSRTALRFVSILLAGSIGINAWLMHTLMVIRSPGIEQHHLDVGTVVPPVDVTDSAGRRVTLGFGPDSLPIVLYWFGPQCSWCRRNETEVERLARALNGKYRFISVASSRNGLTEYLSSSSANRPIYSDETGNIRSAYGLGSTPQTIVFSTQGTLVKSWTGTYEGDTRVDIERFFNIRFDDETSVASGPLTCKTCTVDSAAVTGSSRRNAK